ncbi:septal ring lytic transglycosylase RlpA family protein [Flavobacterium franklandianum]|uniref:septal ring lytic transglycosylase RlpA family protein n=1 Tax=Flavobacterium franklandianum TaxID=2594430 RepID=UPI002939449C|nr:septal ring lytic transglycosylase RlpA family protein [Flavobacterium franklandianum]
MQLKSQKHPKNNFINWRKKAVTLFISIAFLGIVIGQTSNKDKNKTLKYKDSIAKSKSVIAKNEKMLAIDTIKKNKPLFDQQEVVIDSLFIGTGKFKLYKKSAHASYYADKFHNHKTASGKKYDKNKFSAAHKKLPFGTIVKVTNEANGKSVIVEVTDRGPFVRSREIDLSRKAFMEITGNKSSGNMKVTLEILQK